MLRWLIAILVIAASSYAGGADGPLGYAPLPLGQIPSEAFPPSLPPPDGRPAAYPSPPAPYLAPAERIQLRQESASLAALAPAPPAVVQQVIPPSVVLPPVESNAYIRIDYFHWNEQLDGQDFVNEQGAITTFGYVHRFGIDRVRAEVFGGQVGYVGGVQYDDGTSEPLESHTNYMGFRAELEFLYEPDWAPAATFFAGVGNRFWFRDLPDDVTASGTQVSGYQETWWSFYPYLGLEKKRDLDGGFEFFGSARAGITPFTYQHVSFNDAILYPRLGFTSQLEGGIRGKHLFLSADFDFMNWRESRVVRDSLQPASTMYLVGLKTGFSY